MNAERLFVSYLSAVLIACAMSSSRQNSNESQNNDGNPTSQTSARCSESDFLNQPELGQSESEPDDLAQRTGGENHAPIV
jgi:hypothetical protein